MNAVQVCMRERSEAIFFDLAFQGVPHKTLLTFDMPFGNSNLTCYMGIIMARFLASNDFDATIYLLKSEFGEDLHSTIVNVINLWKQFLMMVNALKKAKEISRPFYDQIKMTSDYLLQKLHASGIFRN